MFNILLFWSQTSSGLYERRSLINKDKDMEFYSSLINLKFLAWKLTANDIKKWFKNLDKYSYIIVDHFYLNDNTPISQVWYYSMYMHHRIILTYYFNMVNPNILKFQNEIIRTFMKAQKHKMQKYL
jgi:hypothetical protein